MLNHQFFVVYFKEAYPWQVVQSSWSGTRYELADSGKPHLLMRAWATESASREIVKLSGKNLDTLRKLATSKDFRPVALGVTMSVDLHSTLTNVESGNVIGVIPGNDATLAQQAVVYTAHHDHLGIKPGKKNEKLIYHGALDNAAGVSAVLAIAKAFGQLQVPLKRSVYFVFTAAEEQGLLGARYFVEHPPIPVKQMIADINYDGVGAYGKTRDISLIGAGKSSLDKQLAILATTQHRIVKPEEKTENGSFYRADQFEFAKVGVPSVYYRSGLDVIGKSRNWAKNKIEYYTKHDYHQPSDILKPEYDFTGAVQDIQLGFYLGVDLANAANTPQWTQGDEFAAMR